MIRSVIRATLEGIVFFLVMIGVVFVTIFSVLTCPIWWLIGKAFSDPVLKR